MHDISMVQSPQPSFPHEERAAVYKAIYTRRDVRDQFLPRADP